jgi:hypothetical protein
MLKCPKCGYIQTGLDPSIHVLYCDIFFFKRILDAKEKREREREIASENYGERTEKE